ncbi:MAG TPA: molybdopterin cofactor-binding domain-containing protein [Candidatus Acidoferrum sp.]
MIAVENISLSADKLGKSRRDFLRGVVGAGAFVLAARYLPGETFAGATAAAGTPSGVADVALKGPLSPSVYLAIDTDGTVYAIAHRSEMGSGSRTALPRIIADELDADWARVKIVQATGDEKYGDQDTDGSHSVRGSFDTLRETGASARLMLVRAAAQQWGVPEGECTTGVHEVLHAKSGKKIGYASLVTAAAKLPVPKKEELKFKSRGEWRYIGKGVTSYDLKDMITGKATYGIDTHMDGMLYANIAHPPVYGAAVKSVDDKATLAVPGVKQTETIDPFKPPIIFQPHGGVGVLASNSWAAIQGKKKLKIEWTDSEHKSFSSDPYKAELQAASRKPGKVVREIGNVDEAFAKGGKVIEAEYYAPMLAHASMEPPAALANYKDGKVEVWAATQNPQGARDAVAAAVGLKKEDVTVNVTLLGGGFGRKSFPDYAAEAAVLSKKSGKPVKVFWTREDDIQFDSFHSVAAMYLKASLGADGKPTAWLQRSTFPPIACTFDASALTADAGEIGLGWSDLPYAIPNHRAENGEAKTHVRIGWLRSVCNVFHAYAEHSFADELAHAAGKDPRDYVLALLGPDRIIPKTELPKDYTNYDGDYAQYPIDTARFRRVLEMATEKAGWGKKKNGNGFGMGLAIHRSFLTYVATVVQVEMDKDGKVKIGRVDAAVDAGTIVNPEMATQQFEGASTFSTSLAFFGEITAKNGVIQQSNFDSYPMARMNIAPRETYVHLVASDAPPAGIGEPGVPPFTPALCNAIFAATGKRVRELPLTKLGLA